MTTKPPRNRDELQALLLEEGIDPRAYSLAGGTREDTYVLEQRFEDRWATYFVERGDRRDEHEHSTEADACRTLADLILKDPTARIHRDDEQSGPTA